MPNPIQVIAPRGRDAEVIVQVLTGAGLEAVTCPGIDTLLPRLGDAGAVVVTEEALAGPALPDLLSRVAAQPAWSDLAFLVLATKQSGPRSAPDAATLNGLGNALLLERPLNAESLRSAARSAIRGRLRQLAVRDLNATLEERVQERTEALTESESRFRAVFETFPDSLYVVTVTGDGQFLFENYNPVAQAVTGYTQDDIAGKPAEAFMPAATAAIVTERFRACLAAGTSLHFNGELRFSGGGRAYDTVITPIADAAGRIVRLLGVARDVTDRNELEIRLRQAQKLEAVGQLTGGVAHDFNNLLQVVLSGLTLMERVTDPERRAQLAESVRRAAQRGGDLTRRLLTIARRQSLQPASVDLGAWIGDGAGELLSRTLRGDISTELKVPRGLPPVEVDPGELELAVLNLAVNARDAMQDGGTLTLTAELVRLDGSTDADGLEGEFVRLSVTDTGSGMSEETQARVFEPFFTTKGVGQGTGLGLAQVYGFARQSGGGVRLQSRLGQGTTVSLLLPLSRRTPAGLPATPGGADTVSRGVAILVCEDDDDVAALVSDMLTQLGHQPTRVTNAAAALGALADGRRVDMLFTDVMMPGGMDGLALAREAGRRRPGMPVLLTTGYTGGGASSVPLGMPVLRKPYRLDELSAAVATTMARAERAYSL